MNLLADPALYVLQLKADEELAVELQARGCPICGGRLDVANYERKPRAGVAQLPPGYEVRFSYCCAEDGCRKRGTPPSLRYLGRRVYVGAVVVLASAMRHGVTPSRAERLRDLTGASRRTLERWRRWWLDVFAVGPLWKGARGLLPSPVSDSQLPASLLDAFHGSERERLMSLLRLLLPLTTVARSAHPE